MNKTNFIKHLEDNYKNYNLLDQSFWDVLSNSISINISNAIKERKSLEPTLEYLHRRFDS